MRPRREFPALPRALPWRRAYSIVTIGAAIAC